jgi:hypothetical protein
VRDLGLRGELLGLAVILEAQAVVGVLDAAGGVGQGLGEAVLAAGLL